MRVLLLSAYAAHSHLHWQRILQSMFPGWDWRELNLPPRHFSWRVRGNPLYWSLAEREVLNAGYDLLLATSMVDLATLRGLVPPLARVPTLLYFHENQFAYPQRAGQASPVEAQMVSLYAALAADRLAFNSAHNRDSFLQGVQALLRKLPDRVPAGVAPLLQAKSEVLPVPVVPAEHEQVQTGWPGSGGETDARPLRLLWSGRFEYDKGPEGLWHLLERLEGLGLDYELALTGQRFRNSPPAFERIARDFSKRLVHFGFMESAGDYRALQRAADLVLSTALHEFQGLAVLEAVAAGCLPVVPDRLVYPEIFPARYRYASSPDRPAEEADCAARLVMSLAREPARDRGAVDVSDFFPAQLRPRYAELLQGLAAVAG